MYKIITFELRFYNGYGNKRAWYANKERDFATVGDIAKHYGADGWRLGFLYRAAYKDSAREERIFFKGPTEFNYSDSKLNYWQSTRVIAFDANGDRVSMVTLYMAAVEHFKSLKRDAHGRIIRHARRFYRSRSGHRMRYQINTNGERKMNGALSDDREDLEELGYRKSMLKHRKRWLPSSWDDLSTYKGSGWKCNRDKQYREKEFHESKRLV